MNIEHHTHPRNHHHNHHNHIYDRISIINHITSSSTLDEQIHHAFQQLKLYRHTHPNLVLNWSKKLQSDVMCLQQTISSLDKAVSLFDSMKDIDFKSIALINMMFSR